MSRARNGCCAICRNLRKNPARAADTPEISVGGPFEPAGLLSTETLTFSETVEVLA